MTVAFRLVLCLPRDASTVPVVRRVLDQALRAFGVADECRDDLCLILTEACANVIDHARTADLYEVSAEVDARQCVIEVVNAGAVVDPTHLVIGRETGVLTDRGRGLGIIRALADDLWLLPGDRGGLTLRAVVSLRWQDAAPAWARVLDAAPDQPFG